MLVYTHLVTVAMESRLPLGFERSSLPA